MTSLHDPMTALGRCLIESQGLVESRRGRAAGAVYVRVTGAEHPGREHWAVLYPDDADATGGTVVDLTARQFDAAARSPWTGPLDDWLDDACEWLADGLHVEVRADFRADATIWADAWSREDVLPGPMARPWEAA